VSWSRTLKIRQILRAQLEMGEEIALLFSDIRGFSAYAAEMGDHAAFRLTQLHEGILKDRISEYGIVVKSLGDGVMAAFESQSLAIRSAVSIQQAFSDDGYRLHRPLCEHGPAVVGTSQEWTDPCPTIDLFANPVA